jgi:hypothetical protein
MEDRRNERLTDAELHAFFDRLFPNDFAGPDVLAELAPDGWERSPLLACFHPSVEQKYVERLQFHEALQSVRNAWRSRRGTTDADEAQSAPPALEDVRREHEPTPVNVDEEVTELVGLCLWDVFSDNHEVIAVDGRSVDIGSFRGAGAFLDEHLTREETGWHRDDYMRFYLGTIWISRRADLAPVYAMIFRRLRALGADWVYHFPQILLTELPTREPGDDDPAAYSVSKATVAELEAQKRRADIARMRDELGAANAEAREEALDRQPPARVRAYRQVYGRDPRGWPPAELPSQDRRN